MARGKSNGAERARLYRDTRRCGSVVVQDIEVSRSGIELLVSHGWLDPEVAHNPVYVRTALVGMINGVLTAPPTPARERSPRLFKQALQAVKVFSLGLL